MIFPDVQSTAVKSFKLTRVGIKGLRKPVTIRRPGREVVLYPEIDLFVDLPSHLKGSHMSRNAEILCEIVDSSIRNPYTGLEHLCADISKMLLERHEYATVAEIDMTADYFLERASPSGNKSLEIFKLIAGAVARRDDATTRTIGVEVTGMTACPCAMETTRILLSNEHAGKDFSNFPTISHNQRNISSLIIEFEGECDIEADDLIDIVEGSLSSPSHEVLKREDEGLVVMRAHKNPKFVEDVVRDILSEVLRGYPGLPDDTIVTVRSESEESIHKHNAFAERVTSMGELRKT
ncbi:MAG: GTP cyclohydrolase I FolE2 [Thermoplasmata archaeon]|nr:GTP cyclohydrolase I FolE2 [Thermoplasmata archaeon]